VQVLGDRPRRVEAEDDAILAHDAACQRGGERAAGLDHGGVRHADLALGNLRERLAAGLRDRERPHQRAPRRQPLAQQPGAEALGSP